jgi:hypothetical protein
LRPQQPSTGHGRPALSFHATRQRPVSSNISVSPLANDPLADGVPTSALWSHCRMAQRPYDLYAVANPRLRPTLLAPDPLALAPEGSAPLRRHKGMRSRQRRPPDKLRRQVFGDTCDSAFNGGELSCDRRSRPSDPVAPPSHWRDLANAFRLRERFRPASSNISASPLANDPLPAGAPTCRTAGAPCACRCAILRRDPMTTRSYDIAAPRRCSWLRVAGYKHPALNHVDVAADSADPPALLRKLRPGTSRDRSEVVAAGLGFQWR